MGTIESCPHCNMPYGGSFMHLNSGLGAPLYACGSCGKTFDSGRQEWPDLSPLGKLRYLAASGVYTAFVSLMHGGFLALIVGRITGKKSDVFLKDFWTDRVLMTCMMVAGSLVIVTQGVRIRRSITRWMRNTPSVAEASIFSLASNRQVITLLAGMIMGFVASML